MERNISFYKEQDKSHIIRNLLSGAKAGIISQFIADTFISILLYNEAIVIEDIRVSQIPSYYASVASGITVAVLAIYMDPFAVVLFSTVAYEYVFNTVSKYLNNEIIEFDSKDVILDSVVVIVLIYLFDPVAHNQYLRYKEKRFMNNPIHRRMDRSMALTIFFIILTNSYNFVTNPNPLEA